MTMARIIGRGIIYTTMWETAYTSLQAEAEAKAKAKAVAHSHKSHKEAGVRCRAASRRRTPQPAIV